MQLQKYSLFSTSSNLAYNIYQLDTYDLKVKPVPVITTVRASVKF